MEPASFLMVVGYSFGDPYTNNVIMDAVIISRGTVENENILRFFEALVPINRIFRQC